MPQILSQKAKTINHIFYRDGKMVKELYKAKNINPTNIDKLDLKTLKNLYVDNIEEFEYYEQIDSVI